MKRITANIGPLCILLTAFIWGFCLVGQATGMKYMGAWSFSAVRLTLGGLSLVFAVFIIDAIKKKNTPEHKPLEEYKAAFKPGLICAPVILSSTMFQQFGLIYTGVGKCAFVTAFYIFLVPLFSTIFGEKIKVKMWIAVMLAMAGLYMITMSSGFDNINIGDVLSFGSAVTYALFIILVDRSVKKVDVLKFSAVQFTICGLLCFIPAFIWEPGQITWENIMLNPWPIIVTGVVSCALGYTIQLIGQKTTKPTTVSMILSSETVFSMIAGMIFLHEVMLVKEYIGCAIMVIAIVLSVLPDKSTKGAL